MTARTIAPYTYRATVLRVLDADTVECQISLGFYLQLTTLVRLLGCNAAELGTPGGDAARDYLTALLPPGTLVELASEKPDKYGGRILATVVLAGVDLAQTLIDRGWAAPWDGRGAKPVPPWPKPIDIPQQRGSTQ